jgi:hypothetical protein
MPLEGGPRTLPELAAALDPAPGVLHGLSYPLAPDFEGLASPLQTLLQRNLAGLGWPARLRWMQITGVDDLVVFSRRDAPELELVDRRQEGGYEAFLYRVQAGAPEAFWPRAVRTAQSPVEALAVVQRFESVRGEAVASRPVAHSADGDVHVESAAPDRVVLSVRGAGGLAVLRRSFHPLWRARVDGESAPTQAVDLVLLGIEVPPGEHRVVVDVASAPERIAAALALATAAVLLATALGLPRRRALP